MIQHKKHDRSYLAQNQLYHDLLILPPILIFAVPQKLYFHQMAAVPSRFTDQMPYELFCFPLKVAEFPKLVLILGILFNLLI